MLSTEHRTPPAAPSRGVELILTGGVVRTLEPGSAATQAIAIRNGRVAAVGPARQIAGLRGPRTEVVDLKGRTVIPGFADAHVHLGSYARTRQQANLELAATLEQGIEVVRAAAAALPEGAWLEGRGWDRNRWGRLPRAADLDAVLSHRPAALRSHDGHSVWLNSLALERIRERIDADPRGKRAERDQRGQPTGVLFEDAQQLLEGVLPEPSVRELAQAIAQALPSLAAAGIVGVHNFEGSLALRALTALRESGVLTLRVYQGIAHHELSTVAESGTGTGAGDEWLRLGPVKLYADGALGSRTAALLAPYEGRSDGYRGELLLDREQLVRDITSAANGGLGVAVHAIGDHAVRTVLDAIEQVRADVPAAAEIPLRIEHAQLVDPSDVPRFAALDVIASMQPLHAVADWRAADEHWGDRSRHAYAWRALLEAGATVAFGTDAPVERIEPLASLHAAVTRQEAGGKPEGGWHPEQRVTLNEAIRAYTLGTAEAEWKAGERGTLALGKAADLVVLSADPFRLASPDEILQLTVEMTVSNGHVVHGLD
ncbi:MAG: amidohydrolase [Chloroflexi bacterium]|nr:amidohydrolase [Chloroflexota bacterium]